MVVKSYSPSNVVVMMTGAAGTSDIVTFDKVDVEYNEDRWGFETSATGHTTRTRSESILGKITFDIPQTAVDNDSIMAQAIEQLAAGTIGSIPGKLTISVNDNWGGSIYNMTEATLVKPQGSNFSKDPNNRTWEFQGELAVNSFDTKGNG